MIVALCGGVGGSKLALGLYRLLGADLTIVVNTADDLDFCGLHVSPDLDTVTYTLAGLSRRDVGWGLEGDTFAALQMLGRYGMETWFQVGDRDLATHLVRTEALRQGETLTAVTDRIRHALGVEARILPMTDDPVATRLLVSGTWLHFQEYFVRRRHQDPVEAVRYDGIDTARPSPEVVAAIESAEAIIIVNSNPVLSILPMLNLPGMRALIGARSVPVVAVSPLVGNDAVTGPAGRLMALIGEVPTAVGVAGAYREIAGGLVIDRSDAPLSSAVEEDGMRVLATNIIMRDEDDRIRLARETLAFARSLA